MLVSCGGRTILHYENGSLDGLLSTSSVAPTAPPDGSMTVKKDAPYAGPYRLPRDRWAYTADTIKEYQLEGKLDPGVYEAGDPILGAALNSFPVPEGDKAASAGSPHDMNEDGMAAPKSGNLRVLIIKVKWANTPTQPIASTASIQKKFFENGTDAQNVSVKEYYGQQSYGALNITGDVYPQGADDAAYQLDGSPDWYGSLVLIPTSKAKALLTACDADINFANYDADNNGFVDAVVFVYQRFGNNWVSREHVGFIPTSNFYEADFTKDSKLILRAAFLDYTSFDNYDDASFCWWEYTPHHEFGHILGMPDLYDYGGDMTGQNNPGPDGDESNGNGFWSLMAAGNMTYPIANLGGPLKYCMGWTNATMITSNLKDFHVAPTNASANNVMRIWRNGEEGLEYFIIENDPTADRGFLYYVLSGGSYIPGGDIYSGMTTLCMLNPGLLIWHVDERVWYEGNIFSDVGPWGWGCNDHEERKFVDLEESTTSYNLSLGADGFIIDDKDYMGGKYDPWPETTATRFAPDTTPDSDAYVLFSDTNSFATNVTISNIRHDGTDAIIDLSIGAPYIHFPEPSPMILTSSASILPDVVENTVSLDYYDSNDALLGSFTDVPWGLDLDTSGISFGNLNLRVHANGVLAELSTDTPISYIVDNTPGAYPVVSNFETTNDFLAAWATDSTGLFKKQSGGYNSGSSFGVYDSGSTTNYPPNLKSFAVLPRVNLPASPAPAPTLTFRTHYNLEDGMDMGRIFISTDNFQNDWTELTMRNGDPAHFTGYLADWTSTHIRISNWAGQTVSIGFLLETNGSVAGQSTSQPAGWWIDQIVLANGWAESVPNIISTGLASPPNYGVVYSKPQLTSTIAANNGSIKVHYTLTTTEGQTTGDLTTAPFELSLDVSTLKNQWATLSLQAFDSNGIGSPIVEVPVAIFNLIGDVNGDGFVDNADHSALIPLLGLGSADAGYLPWADSNQSGNIDEADLAAVGYFWGSSL